MKLQCRAFGLALALAKDGYFEWEEFRQALIARMAAWERSHRLDDPEWDYYQCWLEALESVMSQAGLIGPAPSGSRPDYIVEE